MQAARHPPEPCIKKMMEEGQNREESKRNKRTKICEKTKEREEKRLEKEQNWENPRE